MKLVDYKSHDEMLEWAVAHGGTMSFRDDAKPIGMRDNGALIAVTVFDSFTTTGCWVHVVSNGGKRWVNKEYIIRVFAYPFLQCNYPRLNSFVSVNNKAAIAFNEWFGFVREGVLREAGDDGEDLIVFGLLRRECRWLPENAGKASVSAV